MISDKQHGSLLQALVLERNPKSRHSLPMKIVTVENLFDLQDTLIKIVNNPSWKYEVVKEDTKYLWQRLQNIYSSPKPLVKIKLSKLLVARRIVSVHAWKGRSIRLKSTQCQLTYDILLQRIYDNHLLRCQVYWITTSAKKKYELPLQFVTIKHPFKLGKFNVFGKIIPNFFKMHKYILTDATDLMVNYYEAIQYSQCNVIIRFGVPNGLVFTSLISIWLTIFFESFKRLLSNFTKIGIKRFIFYIGKIGWHLELLWGHLLVYGKRAIPSLDICLLSLVLAQYVWRQSFDSFQSLQGDLENIPINALVLKW